MVEDPLGVENFKEILKIDGVDCIWIGGVDLSIYLGYPGQTGHPQVLAARDKVERLAEKYGKYTNITAYNPEVDIAPYKGRPLLTTYMVPKPEPFIVGAYKKLCDSIKEVLER